MLGMGTVPEHLNIQDLQAENTEISSHCQPREFCSNRSRHKKRPLLTKDGTNSSDVCASGSNGNFKCSIDISFNFNKRKDTGNSCFRGQSKASNKYTNASSLLLENKESDFASSTDANTPNPCNIVIHDTLDQQQKTVENVGTTETCSTVVGGDSLPNNEALGYNHSQNSRGHIVGGRYVRKNTAPPRKRSNIEISVPPETLNDFRLLRSPVGKFQRKNNIAHNFGSREDNYGMFYCRSDDMPYNQGNFHTDLNLLKKGNQMTERRSSRNGRCGNSYNMEHFNSEVNLSTVRRTKPRFYASDKSNTSLKFHSRSLDRGVNQSSNESRENFHYKTAFKDNDAAQLERLTYQLREGEYECMVCCDTIKVKDHIWNCRSCFHVFHLWCIRKWARSPAATVEESGWRCPACQNISKRVPFQYYCFCGKCKEPEVNHHLTPHSCGEVCGNLRSSTDCPHHCNILCHPGPCPPCSASVVKECGCGRLKKTVLCKHTGSVTCDSVCGRSLNCRVHECKELCHSGDCEPCSAMFTLECFCTKTTREAPCSVASSNGEQFSCGNTCDRLLMCGHHYCDLLCHEGQCNGCKFLPSTLKWCPCGKTLLDSLYEENESLKRKTCTDPVPVCSSKCDKLLKCGPKDNPHKCDFQCHTGDCPPCSLSTTVKCRCGAITKEVPCSKFVLSPILLCERRCNRRKECGRHKCLNLCCVNIEHKCELICNKKLTCGNHQCQELCHNGNCPVCPNVSFEELACRCGASVLFPPVHCGTKPPECREPCNRSHACDHPVQHSCHSDENCPPCTVLISMWCFGKHMQRKSVQCFLDGISCGLPCNKPLPCGFHKCLEICHKGSCLKNGSQCTQPCSIQRPDCGHPCRAPCHTDSCPIVPCKTKVNMKCPCGHRSEIVVCSDNSKSYHLMSVSMLATKMQDIKLGHSLNISDVLGKKNKLNRLQCNEECAILERNKRLALALQIQNPELSTKPGPPSYSEFLKEEVKKNQHFVSSIHDKLTELVQLAKQSKKKSRSHAFPPMNRNQRRVIHELAEFFGCETQSYDEEPKKSVTVTASRDKCWIPFASVISVVQREMGLRKGPTPMVGNQAKPRGSHDQTPTFNQKVRTIDYFDFTGS